MSSRGLLKLLGCLTVCANLLWLPACKKETIVPIDLVSVNSSNGSNLTNNGGVIEITDAIVVTYSTDINPLSVTDSTVTITREYDHTRIPLTMIIFRSALSIKPIADLLPGAYYTLFINSTIQSSHGLAVQPLTIRFKTAGTFVPTGQRAYWSFEESANDVIGTWDPASPADDVIGVTYVDGRNAIAGKAASFNGNNSIIQVNSGSQLLTPEFSISFWMYLNSEGHTTSTGKQKSSFVLGTGNFHGLEFDVDSTYKWIRFYQGYLLDDKITTMTNEFQFFGNGIMHGDPEADGGIENATIVNQPIDSTGIRALLDNTWVNVIMTQKDSIGIKMRSLYINGELMYQQDLLYLANDDAVSSALRPLATVNTLKFIPDINVPATYDDKFVFGFWQSQTSTFGGESGTYTNTDANHFKGLLDDVRIFNRMITDEEIVMMYNDEK